MTSYLQEIRMLGNPPEASILYQIPWYPIASMSYRVVYPVSGCIPSGARYHIYLVSHMRHVPSFVRDLCCS